MTMFQTNQRIWVAGADEQQHAATVLRDTGHAKVLIAIDEGAAAWVHRVRLTPQDGFLAANEAPAPANAHYYGGVMGERLARRNGR